MQDSPRKYGVPHDTWRPNQHALLKDVFHNQGKFIIAEMGTGSGKSAIATAMGHEENVLVVVHTLGLLDQYESLYGFSIIKGRQEYPCALVDKVDAWKNLYGVGVVPTAADCHYSPMHKCEVAHNCSYLIAKQRALAAKRAACTYRYVGVSKLMKERTGQIVLDEAHDAAEELIRFNEFAYKYSTLKKHGLPPFPISTYGEGGRGAVLSGDGKTKVATWLTSCIAALGQKKEDSAIPIPTQESFLVEIAAEVERKASKKSEKTDKEIARRQRVRDRFIRMHENLYATEWFLQAKPYEVSLKALSAIAVADQVFAHKSTKLLMSATIGDPEPLAKALGIEAYEFLTFAHPVPKSHRTIKKLGVDRMTARNLKERPQLYKEQASAVWKWIVKMPPSWRGVILTTSYKKIEELYRHLLVPTSTVPQPRRLARQQKGEKVSALVEHFITDVRPGDIMIGTIQGWGSGLDLRGELARWIVIAGVPHANPTDQYMKARRKIEGGQAYQKWVTFNAVMQACGRVSRGEYDDFNDDWLPNYAALADGSALSPTALKYYGQWFLEALI